MAISCRCALASDVRVMVNRAANDAARMRSILACLLEQVRRR